MYGASAPGTLHAQATQQQNANRAFSPDQSRSGFLIGAYRICWPRFFSTPEQRSSADYTGEHTTTAGVFLPGGCGCSDGPAALAGFQAFFVFATLQSRATQDRKSDVQGAERADSKCSGKLLSNRRRHRMPISLGSPGESPTFVGNTPFLGRTVSPITVAKELPSRRCAGSPTPRLGSLFNRMARNFR